MRTLLVALVVGLVLLTASCSSDPGPSETDRYSVDEPDDFDVDGSDIRSGAVEVCASVPLEQFGTDYGVPNPTPQSAAEAYAGDYVDQFRQDAFEGCLEGIQQRLAGGG